MRHYEKKQNIQNSGGKYFVFYSLLTSQFILHSSTSSIFQKNERMAWEKKLNIEQNDEMVVRMNEIQSRKWRKK